MPLLPLQWTEVLLASSQSTISLKAFAFEAYGISSVLAEHRIDSCPDPLLGGSLHEELSLVKANAHHICHSLWDHHRMTSLNDNFVHTSLFV